MENKSLGSGNNRPRRSGRYITTRSGKALKVNQSMGEKWKAMKEAKSLRKVNRMRGLPKSRLKRVIWRLQPKRLADYWFSRDGGITALKALGIAILVFFILTIGVFAYFRKDLPNIKDISGSNLGGSISYYDKTGQTLLWQDYNQVKRVPVDSTAIAQPVKNATVAVEDRDFYKHRGFDIKGIVRAALNDIFHRGSTQGGSTITQQLVKLTQDWNQQRTFGRKVKELILAVELERTYTKDEILTGYLNSAPYGGLDYGVESASQDYFHKSAKDLSLEESAFLAAIPKSPDIYSPRSPDFNSKDFTNRYDYVLDSLVQTDKISKQQADAAKKVDILAEVQPQQNQYAGIQSPYFVLAAKDEILTKFASQGAGSKNKIGGWKVITTMDLNLQHKAEDLVASNASLVARYGGDEEAMVVEDVQTGQMQALVGGEDFNNPDHGQINYAHDVNISPGSSFKPYDYSTLIDNNNAGAGSVLYDQIGAIPGYPCTDKSRPSFTGGTQSNNANCLWDYDFRNPGPITLRYALAGSRNIPAVKAMLEAKPNDTSTDKTDSVNKTISTANALMDNPDAYRCFKEGTDVSKATKADEDQCGGASAIGDGAYLHLDEHVNGVASLGRLGKAIPSTYILQIYDSSSSTKPFYQWKQPKDGDTGVKQVVNPQTAYIVDNMLSDPNASYLVGSYYKYQHYNGWNIAVKTGTTNNSFDGLMMAWSTKYAVGSWVGYHTRTKALTTFMETMTTPLTKGMITYALDSSHQSPQNWQEPAGIQHLPAFVVRNKISANGEVVPSPSTDIFPSWYKQSSGTGSSSTIDKVSNKLATSCTPDLAKQTSAGSGDANKFSIDIFFGTGGAANAANTSATDDVHSCADSKPSITLSGPTTCTGTCTFVATASQGTHPLNDPQYPQFPGTINLLANGQVVQTKTFSDTDSTTVSFDYSDNGSVTLTAQVIDSVLYDSTSDGLTVSFNATPAGPTNLSASASGSNINFNWTGGTAPYTVYRADTNATMCVSNSATACTGSKTGTTGSTQFYVRDANNQTNGPAHY